VLVFSFLVRKCCQFAHSMWLNSIVDSALDSTLKVLVHCVVNYGPGPLSPGSIIGDLGCKKAYHATHLVMVMQIPAGLCTTPLAIDFGKLLFLFLPMLKICRLCILCYELSVLRMCNVTLVGNFDNLL